MNKAVLIEIQDSIAIITLNRPDRYNSVNQDLLDGFNESFSIVENDDSIRAVVLTGNGKGFCAGADMSTFGLITPEQSRDYIVEKYKPLMKRFLGLKKPIIGAINGTAAGVGAAFALACDFRVMGPKSSIYFAFINIGLGPDGGGSWLLSRLVGYSKALEIAISGEKIFDLLSTGSPFNFNDFRSKKGSSAQTLLTQIDVIIYHNQINSVNLFVRRSFSEHLMSWINDSASRL